MIPLIKDTFIEEENTKKSLAEFILSSSKLSMGDLCEKFEKKFSEFQDRKHAILFNSGGSANLALLQSLKNLGYLKDNSKIGFSALTWSTNVMPIIQLGMIPIALDCDPESLNVMSKNILETIKETDLDAIFITNVLGFTGDLEKIREVCSKRKIILMEDNCEALGASYKGIKTGTFGLCGSFSTFFSHHISTMEGGIVATNNEEIYQILLSLRAHGWTRNLPKNNLITVVGCGGNRDKTKRPVMGDIASNLSSKVIFTSDNPRYEDPESIIEEMLKGVKSTNTNKTISITNRKEAIKTACQFAQSNDIILVAGKGHESYQEVKGVKSDFDDFKIIKDLLNQKN